MLAYVLFTLALVITPGATTAVVVRNTLAGGRGGGLATAAGAAAANSSHAAAAGLGLALVLARMPLALGGLRTAGAMYLVWLGIASFRRALRSGRNIVALAAVAPSSRRRYFRDGLMVNLLSPAILTFYLVVVPSFVPPRASAWTFAAMAAVHVGLAWTCHAVWALAFDRLRRVFDRPGARRALEALSGLALVGLAAKVLLA